MKHSILAGFSLLALVGACAAPVDRTTDESAAVTSSADDGTPEREPCVSQFADGLYGTFGRLDGTIVAVVPPRQSGAPRQCNADRDHVHLQIAMAGGTYDVAVNVDGGFIAEVDHALPGDPWQEGWHRGGALDYKRDLDLKSTDFRQGNRTAIDHELEAALASANHVSVYATLFSHGGIHLVHRRGRNEDGAVILNPLSATAKVYAFRFTNDTF